MEMDDHYSTDTEDSGPAIGQDDSNNNDAESRRVSPRLGPSEKRRKLERNRVVLPTNLQAISQMKNSVSKRLKGSSITEGLSLRVIRRVLVIKETHVRRQGKKLKDRDGKVITYPTPVIAHEICKEFGIGKTQYTNIAKAYFTADPRRRQVYSTGEDGMKPGNTKAKERRVPITTENRLMTQVFVREQRTKRQRVTARQLVDFLVEKGQLKINRDETGLFDKKSLETAYRAVRRFVEALGYQRGKRTGNIIQKRSVVEHKAKYLREFFANRAVPAEDRMREVYMDESYIHEHYHRNDDSIWDPNDDQDVQMSKAPAKGRRYCFAAAIQGPDPRVVEHDGLPLERKAGLVPGTVWAFCPQKKGAHTGDYHKVFNGTNFLQWWKDQLLPNLHQPSLIMMDNASYHKVKTAAPNLGRMKKAELMQWLTEQGVTLEDGLTALEVRSKAREYIKTSIPMDCCKLAEEAGHKVLFTPPYHSDIQPIELVWALVKGNVGRQYNSDTTLSLVYARLMEEFKKLEESGHSSVGKMIAKCADLAHHMYQDGLEEDDADDYDTEDEEGVLGDQQEVLGDQMEEPGEQMEAPEEEEDSKIAAV